MVLDHYDDDGRYLRTVFAEKGVPHIVKVAARLAGVPAERGDYALEYTTPTGVQHCYPLADPGNALASAIYFDKYAHQLEDETRKEVAGKIKAALESFGLPVDEDLSKEAAIEVSQSEEAGDAALMAMFSSSTTDMDVLTDHFNDCTPRGKQRVMMQVKTAGVEFNDGNAYISNTYGPDFEMALDARRIFVAEDDEKARLDDMKKEAASTTAQDMVDSLTEFDVDNQLVHLYNKFLPDPHQSVCGELLEKDASVSTQFRGEQVSQDQLKDLITSKYDNLAESFGKEAADQLIEDPISVFDSLPVPQKQAIEALYE